MNTTIVFDHAVTMDEQREDMRQDQFLLRYARRRRLERDAEALFEDINIKIQIAHGDLKWDDIIEIII